jgi:hypothetical protein
LYLSPSDGTAQAHLRALERKGALKRRPFQARGLSLTAREERSGGEAVRNVPILGPVAAGTPRLAVENIAGVSALYAEWAMGEELVFGRVKGESMMPTLWDRDNLLMRRQATVENDAIAVALIEGMVPAFVSWNVFGSECRTSASTLIRSWCAKGRAIRIGSRCCRPWSKLRLWRILSAFAYHGA